MYPSGLDSREQIHKSPPHLLPKETSYAHMNRRKHRIALVCMTPQTDAGELSRMKLPSYGVRRIMAALLADPELADVDVALIDVGRPDVEAYVTAIDNFAPDLIGFSAYIWSTPTLVEVARRVKRLYPRCTLVFGGPSARPAMFDLPPYRPATDYLDAVVPSEGELVFRDIARGVLKSREGLASIPGMHLPLADGWSYTGSPILNDHLNTLPSPFQMDLMEPNSVAYLETFRGCPMSCVFCEWGATGIPKNIFSVDTLTRELEAYARRGSPAVFSVDAGLNLNTRAFRNLMEAEARVGFLRTTAFWCEVYPSHLKEEHLEFLTAVPTGYIGVGLQTLTPQALDGLQRPFDLRRFETAVRQLAAITDIEIQIIFGLPGDSPEGFLRTLEYARTLPAGVRAYHCLVLPDALMDRGLPEWVMQFDHITLAMQSCLGWENGSINAMRVHLAHLSRTSDGTQGDYWWHFPRKV
jgi:radical SAM superfamily enzyme YgiQ (UPF0313 family)